MSEKRLPKAVEILEAKNGRMRRIKVVAVPEWYEPLDTPHFKDPHFVEDIWYEILENGIIVKHRFCPVCGFEEKENVIKVTAICKCKRKSCSFPDFINSLDEFPLREVPTLEVRARFLYFLERECVEKKEFQPETVTYEYTPPLATITKIRRKIQRQKRSKIPLVTRYIFTRVWEEWEKRNFKPPTPPKGGLSGERRQRM